MDKQLFEKLINAEEGPLLDFKEGQYPFSKATEVEKSEILKDILGFINLTREYTAYILIGVRDVRGVKKQVVGLQGGCHLDDHSLQQFVNSMTNAPVRFHYEAFQYDGKDVGIIELPVQRRPVYLTKDFGKLVKSAVYVRRGSSTDPTRPASPEEIALIGELRATHPVELLIQFADPVLESPLGRELKWRTINLSVPDEDTIPDHLPKSFPGPYGNAPLHSMLIRNNKDYWRELAEHEFAHSLCREFSVSVENTSRVVAQNVLLQLVLLEKQEALLVTKREMPRFPEATSGAADALGKFGLGESNSGSRPTFRLAEFDDRVVLESAIGDIQPGRMIFTDVACFGKFESGYQSIYAKLFANNLPEPSESLLGFDVDVEFRDLSLEDLYEIASAKATK